MSDRLWSPQMRKWARDAHLHGIQIGFARTGIQRWDGGGAGIADNAQRFTDDGGMRILDSPQGIFNTAQPRTVDFITTFRGPTVPLFVPTAAGVNKVNIKIGGQTIINYGGPGMKI